MVNTKGRNTKSTSFSLNIGILDRLDAYSDVSNLSKTKIVEQALTEFLDKKAQELCADLMPGWKPKTLEEINAERIQKFTELHEKGLIFDDDYKEAIAQLSGKPIESDDIGLCVYADESNPHTTFLIDSMEFTSLDEALASGKLSEDQVKRVLTRIDKDKRYLDWLNQHKDGLDSTET